MTAELYEGSWDLFSRGDTDDRKFSVQAWDRRGVLSDLTADSQPALDEEFDPEQSATSLRNHARVDPQLKKEKGRQPLRKAGSLSEAAHDALSLRNRTTSTGYASEHIAEALLRFRSGANIIGVGNEVARRLAGRRVVDIYGVAHGLHRLSVEDCVRDMAMTMIDEGEAQAIAKRGELRDNLAPTLRRLNGALIERSLGVIESNLELFCANRSARGQFSKAPVAPSAIKIAERYYDPTDLSGHFWKTDTPAARPRADHRTIEDRASAYINSKQYRHHRSTNPLENVEDATEHGLIGPRELPGDTFSARAKGGNGLRAGKSKYSAEASPLCPNPSWHHAADEAGQLFGAVC